MKRYRTLYITILAILLVFMSNPKARGQDSLLIVGERTNLHSKVLDEARTIWIHLPHAYHSSDKAVKRYPVVYLLDSEFNFLTTIGVLDALRGGRGKEAPEVILVGIENTDRTRDLTPTPAISKRGQGTLENSGGGELFVSFLEKELLPLIDGQFRTAERRVLIGHSFGGLTAINILLKHTSLFSDYLAIDPSFWWDDSKLLREAEELLDNTTFDDVRLFIANSGMQRNNRLTDHEKTKSFPEILKAHDALALRWSHRLFEHENHGSVILPALFYGLRFIYQEDGHRN